jgi:hypothetical protein
LTSHQGDDRMSFVVDFDPIFVLEKEGGSAGNSFRTSARSKCTKAVP